MTDATGPEIVLTRHTQPAGPEIVTASAPVIEVDGRLFKNSSGSGTLLPYEDWRLDADARARFARLTQLHVLLEQMFADASRHEEEAVPSTAGSQDAAAALRPPIAALDNTIHGAIGYLSSGWPVAYLVATVVFAVGLVIGAIVHVSQPDRFAWVTPTVTEGQDANAPDAAEHDGPVVGRITGVADCVWDDSDASHQKSGIRNQ